MGALYSVNAPPSPRENGGWGKHKGMEHYYMLTIRYQSSNTDFFEDLISFFKANIADNFTKHISSIEFDGTSDRHLHFIFECSKKKDRSKVLPYLKGLFNPIIKKTRLSDTLIDKNWKYKSFQLTNKFKDDEVYYKLGYGMKASPVRFWYKGFTIQQVYDYKENYLNFLKIENKKPTSTFNFTHLTIKNVIPKMCDYVRKNKEKIVWDKLGTNLKYLMMREHYIFIELSKEKMEHIYQHLKLWFDEDKFDDEIQLQTYNYNDEITSVGIDLSDTPRYELVKEIEHLRHEVQTARQTDIDDYIKKYQDEVELRQQYFQEIQSLKVDNNILKDKVKELILEMEM